MSIASLFGMAFIMNILLISEGFGRGAIVGAVFSDTTNPGQGTGLYGAGKGPSPVLLGKAGDYVILAKTGISTTGATVITGNIGASPVAASYITGFSLLDPPSTYSSSSMVTGKVYAADYDSPTPSNLTVAVLDMETAYSDAAGRAPDYTELGAGNIGGMTLAPATYKWSTSLLIAADVTLSGGPHDVWIFQVAGNLMQSSGVRITLQGGALPRNVFWQVAGASTHETTSHFEGVLLSQTAIILKTGATFHGRQFAQSAVVLDANVVKQSDMLIEPGTATLKAIVRKASDSTLVLNSIVVLRKGGLLIDSSRVDSMGQCTFSNLPIGNNYSIVASAAAFFQTSSPLALPADSNKVINLYLILKVAGTLGGTVKNSQNIPMTNALVVLRHSSIGPIIDSGRTNASGVYIFNNVVPGTPNYWITVTTSLGTVVNENIQVASGGTSISDFKFAPTSLYPTFSNTSGKIHFVPMGDRLAVDLKASAANRTLSVFGMEGSIRLRIAVPAGQARTLVPASLSPVHGYRFEVK